jgi:hypothetical protein
LRHDVGTAQRLAVSHSNAPIDSVYNRLNEL